MIATDCVAVVLLAAGMSTRFGRRDKLATPLNGLPLGLHAARTLGTLPFAARIAVTTANSPDFAAYGFTPIVNDDPGAGQSASIRMGLAQALVARPEAVLIALADMPFLTVPHVEALLARLDGRHPVVGSTDGTQPGPPVLFGSSLFERLRELSGDAGARTMLRGALLVTAPRSELEDIDTLADFAAASTPNRRS